MYIHTQFTLKLWMYTPLTYLDSAFCTDYIEFSLLNLQFITIATTTTMSQHFKVFSSFYDLL